MAQSGSRLLDQISKAVQIVEGLFARSDEAESRLHHSVCIILRLRRLSIRKTDCSPSSYNSDSQTKLQLR